MDPRIDELTARLIRNTIKRNHSRADNILVIAKDIRELIQLTGDIKKAAELIGISIVMLKKFLSVNNLSEKVKKLVEERKFDNVQAIYDIKSLSPEEQLKVANYVINKKITASDVKTIIPEKNKNKEVPIEKIINQLISSKDIKIYSAFIKSDKKINRQQTESLLYNKIDKRYIHSIKIDGSIIKICFTKDGYDYIKNESSKKNKKLKDYLNFIING